MRANRNCGGRCGTLVAYPSPRPRVALDAAHDAWVLHSPANGDSSAGKARMWSGLDDFVKKATDVGTKLGEQFEEGLDRLDEGMDRIEPSRSELEAIGRDAGSVLRQAGRVGARAGAGVGAPTRGVDAAEDDDDVAEAARLLEQMQVPRVHGMGMHNFA